MRALLVLALAACAEDAVQVATGETPKEIADRTCREQDWDCEYVYQFDQTPAVNPLGLLEMCVHKKDLTMAEELFGPSQWSTHERFGTAIALGIGPACIWCGAFGCNAYNGCFNCPPSETP